MVISGIYNLNYNSEWRAQPLEARYLECDTTAGPVTINLFEINTVDLFWNVKLYITDVSSNAASNNITINTGGADKIDSDGTTSIAITTNGGSLVLEIANNDTWLSSAGGGGGIPYYQYAEIQQGLVSQHTPSDATYGRFCENVGGSTQYGLVTLNNGNVAQISYCQGSLADGTFIYECYDLETAEDITGYWVAFRQDPTNNNQLLKVSELKMTQQFWDYWYNYTHQTETKPLDIFFISYTNIYSGGTVPIESFVTKLSLVNDVLIASDTYFNYAGQTFYSLYQNLTGIDPSSELGFTFIEPYSAAYNDYYGMMDGPKVGFVYYGYTTGPSNGVYDNIVGYNVLTGQTIRLQPKASLAAVSNLNPVIPIDDTLFNKTIIAHPKGCIFQIYDGGTPDNGNNTLGVTALWSPNWDNPKKCVFINNRNLLTSQDLIFESIGNNIAVNLGDGSAWFPVFSTNYFYIVQTGPSAFGSASTFILWRFGLENEIIDKYIYPMTEQWGGGWNYWQLNNLVFFNVTGGFVRGESFSKENYYFLQEGEFLVKKIHSDTYYPTNFIGQKIAGASSTLNNNSLLTAYCYNNFKTINVK